MPNLQLFHMYKHMAPHTDPDAKAMLASEAAVEIARLKMLTWPTPTQGGMRLSGDALDSLMMRIREKRGLALEIEQHHISHSHLDVVDVRHFLLRKSTLS